MGVDVRVVGNDAGQELSILSGTISRLDRNVPDIGYMDINTAYYDASTDATGGSSGSPVVAIDGSVLALLCAEITKASTNMHLPLMAPMRVLGCLQQDQHVTRGDIQCVFEFQPYDECRSKGLTHDLELKFRKAFPKQNGLLVVKTVLVSGPSDGKIQVGDMLITTNDALTARFIDLENILDANIHTVIHMRLQRNGNIVSVKIQVDDLHEITPKSFVKFSGAVFHTLSYKQALYSEVPVGGVCMPSPFFEIEDECVIQAIDGHECPDLEAFIEVARKIPHNTRVTLEYRILSDFAHKKTKQIHVDRHWYRKMELVSRNNESGSWEHVDLGSPLPSLSPTKQLASFNCLSHLAPQAGVHQSFVDVRSWLRLHVDGFRKVSTSGKGLVVDADRGLVLVSRAVIPHSACHVEIEIAESLIVDGTVRFVHPYGGWVLVQINSLVTAPIKKVELSNEYLECGAEVDFFGYKHDGQPVHCTASVADMKLMSIPADSASLQYRTINAHAILVDEKTAQECDFGILSIGGKIHAVWLSHFGYEDNRYITTRFALGTPSMISIIQSTKPQVWVLPVELESIKISEALDLGVPEDAIVKVMRTNVVCPRFFRVGRRTVIDEDHLLEEGDVILSLNTKPLTKASDFDAMYLKSDLDVVVVRKHEKIALKVPTVPMGSPETDHVVLFCGATLQKPHHAVRQRVGKIPSDVYLASIYLGSPADETTMYTQHFITHLNDIKTPDLDTFVDVARNIPDRTGQPAQISWMKIVTDFFSLDVAVTVESCWASKAKLSVRTDWDNFPLAQWINKGDAWEEISL